MYIIYHTYCAFVGLDTKLHEIRCTYFKINNTSSQPSFYLWPLTDTRKSSASLIIFFLPLNQQSEYWVLYELMCWLTIVVRSPPARRSLLWIQSLLIDLRLLANEVATLRLNLLTTQTIVTTGILPLRGNFPW
jgi:hypothetical protein